MNECSSNRGRAAPRQPRARGFTLIELMITVVIATVLVTIAIPAYTSQVRKSRRTDARTALLDLAARTERMYSTTNSYLDGAGKLTTADVGYSGAWPITVGSGYYTVNVVATASTYTFTATPVGPQASDTDCQSFTVDQTGAQSATNSAAADSTTTCWNN
jgi:type IV pilus assembly protein PilE